MEMRGTGSSIGHGPDHFGPCVQCGAVVRCELGRCPVCGAYRFRDRHGHVYTQGSFNLAMRPPARSAGRLMDEPIEVNPVSSAA